MIDYTKFHEYEIRDDNGNVVIPGEYTKETYFMNRWTNAPGQMDYIAANLHFLNESLKTLKGEVSYDELKNNIADLTVSLDNRMTALDDKINSLSGSSGVTEDTDLSVALTQLRNEFEEFKRTTNSSISNFDTIYGSKIDNLTDKVNTSNTNNESRIDAAIDAVNSQINSALNEEETGTLQVLLAQSVELLTQKINALQEEIDGLDAVYERKFTNMKLEIMQTVGDELGAAQIRNDEALKDLNFRIDKFSKETEQKLADFSSDFDTKSTELQNRMDSEFSNLNNKYEIIYNDAKTSVENLDSTLTEYKADINTKLDDLKTYAEDSYNELVTKTDNMTSEVRQAIDLTKSEVEDYMDTQLGHEGSDHTVTQEESEDPTSIYYGIPAGTVVVGESTGMFKVIDDTKEELLGEIDATETELMTQLEGTRVEIQDKINNSKTELENKIAETKDGLNSQITEVNGNLSSQITTMNDSLSDRITSVNTELGNRITSINTDLDTKITNVQESLDKEISDTRTELTENLTNTTSQIQGNIKDLDDKYTGEIADLGSSLTGKIDTAESTLNQKIEDLANRVKDTNANASTIQGILSVAMSGQDSVAEVHTRGNSLQLIAGQNNVETIVPHTSSDIEGGRFYTFILEPEKTYAIATRVRDIAKSNYITDSIGTSYTGDNNILITGDGQYPLGYILGDYVTVKDSVVGVVSYNAEILPDSQMVAVIDVTELSNAYISQINMGNGVISLDGKLINITGETVFNDDAIIKGTMTTGKVAINNSNVVLDKSGLNISLDNGSTIVYNADGQSYVDSNGSKFAGLGRFQFGECEDNHYVLFDTPWDVKPKVIMIPTSYDIDIPSSDTHVRLRNVCRAEDVSKYGFMPRIYSTAYYDLESVSTSTDCTYSMNAYKTGEYEYGAINSDFSYGIATFEATSNEEATILNTTFDIDYTLQANFRQNSTTHTWEFFYPNRYMYDFSLYSSVYNKINRLLDEGYILSSYTLSGQQRDINMGEAFKINIDNKVLPEENAPSQMSSGSICAVICFTDSSSDYSTTKNSLTIYPIYADMARQIFNKAITGECTDTEHGYLYYTNGTLTKLTLKYPLAFVTVDEESTIDWKNNVLSKYIYPWQVNLDREYSWQTMTPQDFSDLISGLGEGSDGSGLKPFMITYRGADGILRLFKNNIGTEWSYPFVSSVKYNQFDYDIFKLTESYYGKGVLSYTDKDSQLYFKALGRNKKLGIDMEDLGETASVIRTIEAACNGGKEFSDGTYFIAHNRNDGTGYSDTYTHFRLCVDLKQNGELLVRKMGDFSGAAGTASFKLNSDIAPKTPIQVEAEIIRPYKFYYNYEDSIYNNSLFSLVKDLRINASSMWNRTNESTRKYGYIPEGEGFTFSKEGCEDVVISLVNMYGESYNGAWMYYDEISKTPRVLDTISSSLSIRARDESIFATTSSEDVYNGSGMYILVDVGDVDDKTPGGEEPEGPTEEEEIAKLQEEVSSLENEVLSKQEELSNLRASKTAIDGEISTLNTEIASLEAEYSETESGYDSIEENLDTLIGGA